MGDAEKAIIFDRSELPLLQVHYRRPFNDVELAAHVEDMLDVYVRREQKFANVCQIEVQANAKQRKIMAEALAAHREVIQKYNMGVAFVVKSPVLRGLLTAVFWLAPQPSPYIITGSVEQGRAWAIEQLRKAGVPFPS